MANKANKKENNFNTKFYPRMTYRVYFSTYVFLPERFTEYN